MKSVRVFALLILGAASLSGCAYFNGLYNANQLAKEAVRAEREGRVGEARSLWSRAAVKAESVSVRYTESKYRDDALLLRGTALYAAGRLEEALEPLELAIVVSPDTSLVERALLVLGRCQLALDNPNDAIVSFTRALPSNDTLLASSAHLWRGRAHAALGSHADAVADFAASSIVDAAFDLAVAQARLGRRSEAERVLAWRVEGDYTEHLWLAVLDSIGIQFPGAASSIVDYLLEVGELSAEQKGVLLLDDGGRWFDAGESELANARFLQVLDVAARYPVSDLARLMFYVSRLQTESDLGMLATMLDSVSATEVPDWDMRPSPQELLSVLEMAVGVLEDRGSNTEAGDDRRRAHLDLEMFLAAEALRDKLGAHGLAASLFEEIEFRFPGSPLAPKALLAAASLDSVASDSLIQIARHRYPHSPYVLVLRGLALAEYAALEDSIRSLILLR